MGKQKTNSEFLNELGKRNPLVIPLSTYVNSHLKILCRCVICNYEWEAKPGYLLNGHGCPICGQKRAHEKHKLSSLEISDRLHKKNLNVEIIGEYRTSHEKTLCRCKTCGYEWYTTPHSLFSGYGCPRCAGVLQKNNEAFLRELIEKDILVEPLDPYITAKTKIRCKCKKCKRIWEVEPASLLQGYGCPNCAHTQTSFIEQLIYFYFCSLIGVTEVLHRDRKATGQELDIYIPSRRLAIEYGSMHWHQDYSKDQAKQKRCAERGIELITIFDACTEKTIEGFNKLYCFEYDLGQEKGLHTIKALLEEIRLCYFPGTRCLINERWGSIVRNARQNARRKNHDDFSNALIKINPFIVLLDEYIGDQEKIACKCSKCGNLWKAWPRDLLNGHGCPACAGVKKRDNDDFLSELAKLNTDIEPLEPYISANTAISFRCKKCGYEWRTKPSSLINNKTGCAHCSDRKSAQKRTKSNEDFLRDLEKNNPILEPLEPYVNAKTKIRYRCKKCGFEGNMSPNNMLNGTGCRKCQIKAKGEKRQKAVYCLETRTYYSSLKAAAQAVGTSVSNISGCLQGRQQTAGGYHWMTGEKE